MTSEQVEQEKIKLRAAYVNGLAIGTFPSGAISPVIGFALRPETGTGQMPLAFLITVICFILSFVLHLKATEELSRLNK